MRISTTTEALSERYGDEKAIDAIAHAGFDAIDYSMFVHDEENGVFSSNQFERYAKEIKKTVDSAGIKVGQVHAQMPKPSYPDYLARTKMWDELAKRSIITAAILESPYVVIHPLIMLERKYDFLYQENFKINIEYYNKMIPYLQEYNVKIALENMWNYDDEKNMICPTVCSSAEELLTMCDALGERFVVCLDVGHTVLTGYSPESMVKTIGDKLRVLHVHDNDGYNDLHTIPSDSFASHTNNVPDDRRINWDKFMESLKEIHYEGTFSLEADNYIRQYPAGQEKEALVIMAKTARAMVDKFNL